MNSVQNKFILFVMFSSFSAIAFAGTEKGDRDSLSAKELEAFEEQVTKVVDDLHTYIGIMVDKANPEDKRNKAMQLALKLFDNPEYNTVEVRSVKDPSKKSHRSVKKYFIALRDLPFQSVNLTRVTVGSSIGSIFELGKDGKYYGCLNFFEIYVDGKQSIKGIDSIVVSRRKSSIEKLYCMDGLKEKECWILKLGDIKVDEQRTK